MQPLVSVIVPVYNVEKYIGECLTSVVRQSYSNLEILIVDDCATDRSVSIAEGYLADNRVRIIRHAVNRGLGPSRNTGLDAAKGKYVYFLDSDDWISTDAIDALVREAEKTRSDIVYASSIAFADSPAEQGIADQMNRWFEMYRHPATYTGSEVNIRHMPCMAWSKLYRREFLTSKHLSFVDAKLVHEDEGFFQKCLVNRPQVSVIDTLSYHYRIRQGSLKQSAGASGTNFPDLRKVMADVEAYILQEGLDRAYILELDKYYPELYSCHWGPLSCFWGRGLKEIRIGPYALFKLRRDTQHGTFRLLGLVLRRW